MNGVGDVTFRKNRVNWGQGGDGVVGAGGVPRPPSEPPPEAKDSANDVTTDVAVVTDSTNNLTRAVTIGKKKTRIDSGESVLQSQPISILKKSDSHLYRTPFFPGITQSNDDRTHLHKPKRLKPSTHAPYSGLTLDDHNKIKSIAASIKTYLFMEVDKARVEAIVAEAYVDNDENFTIKQAAEWGEGFTIPREMVEEDEALLASFGGDLEAMAEDRLRQGLERRLNHDRINRLLPDNPERERLHKLVDGMEIFLPSDFTPNGQDEWPKLRNKYLVASGAVNKMILKVHQKKLAFLLWKSTVKKISGSHVSPAHWTDKKGKPEGRTLIDLTDPTRGALNVEDARAKAEEEWDAIEHFTIIMFVVKVLDFFDKCVQEDPTTTWDDIVIYKMDLKGAFNLLSIKSGSVKHMAVELTDDVVALFNCGMFGWCGTPYAFNVVTRALHYQMIHLLFGPSDMFVDDHCGVTKRTHLMTDIAITRSQFVSLLGDEAPEDSKTITSCDQRGQIDIIGYLIDLTLRVVSITKKNFYKTLLGFFSVNLDDAVPVRTLERLASWASRYVIICRWLGPFTRPLYSAYAGLRRSVSVDLTNEAKLSIRLWRAALCALFLDPSRFARPMHTFRTTPYKVAFEFDSSLKGVGILVFVKPGSEELITGGCCVSLDCLDLTQSDYQNMCEFIGIVVGLATLRRLGLLHPSDNTRESVHLRGDSVSALTWAEQERYTGSNVSNASIVYTLMLLAWSVNVSSTEHIDGAISNQRCDYLSRHPHTAKLSDPEVGYPDVPQVNWGGDPVMIRLLRLCDPRTDSKSEEGFKLFWKEAHECISAL